MAESGQPGFSCWQIVSGTPVEEALVVDYRQKFMVGPGESVKRDSIDAHFTGHVASQEEAAELLTAHCQTLENLQ